MNTPSIDNYQKSAFFIASGVLFLNLLFLYENVFLKKAVIDFDRA
jgi:hypothetical protein